MLDIMQTALNGLRNAEARALQSATNIAQLRLADAGVAASTPTGASTGVVTGPAPGESPVTGGGHAFADGQGFSTAGQSDLATDFVALMLAEHAYKANLAVLRTADEMVASLVDSKV
jgi:flagellar hook protein FlgE